MGFYLKQKKYQSNDVFNINFVNQKTFLIFAIDEAQHIPDIGAKLKLMADEVAGIQIIVSGSSFFDLFNPKASQRRDFINRRCSEAQPTVN
jgi:recombinational DNA repair ATPase RecF